MIARQGAHAPLGATAIARFHFPLVAHAWLLALSGPALNFALTRSAEPHVHLAAFWLAASVALLVQSGAGVLQPATAAALRRGVSHARLAAVSSAVGASAALLLAILGATAAGDALFVHAFGASPDIAALARRTLFALAPAPLFVAARGVLTGTLVASGRSMPLAFATAARLAVLAVFTSGLVAPGAQSGALAAAHALVFAAAADLAVAGFFAGAAFGAPLVSLAPSPAPARGGFLRIVGPLAASALVWAAVRPLVNAVLGRHADAVTAHAAFGALVPVLMLTCAPLWCLLETTLALPRDSRDLHAVTRFAGASAAAASLALLVLAWTPFGAAFLARAFSIPAALLPSVAPALALLALEPVVLAVRAVAQGLLLRRGGADHVLALAPLKLALVAGAGFALAPRLPAVGGATLAVGLIVAGDLLDAALALFAVRRLGAHRVGERAAPAAHEREALREAA